MNTTNVRNMIVGEGIPKIYTSVAGKTKEELPPEVGVLKSVPVDVVEWRMDWFREVGCREKAVAMLQALCEIMLEMPIPATFCSRKEGGEPEISTAAYVELNKAIIDSGNVDLIDVELFTGEAQIKELITHAHDKGVRVIMFSHDFDKILSCNETLTRLRTTQILGVDVPKITVIPTCKVGVITLLQATNDMHEDFTDRPIITISMVGAGVLSRLYGEVSGSALTFGIAKKTGVLGQMGVEDLKAVLPLLHESL